MADEKSAAPEVEPEADVERCPRCTTGRLYVTADDEQHRHVHCFACDYHASEVKPGYEVVKPGQPITAIESDENESEG